MAGNNPTASTDESTPSTIIESIPYNRECTENHSLRSNDRSQRRQHKHEPINPTPRSPRNTIIKRIRNPFRMILQRRRLPEIRKYQTRIHNTRKRPLYSLTVVMSQVCKQGFDACDGEEDTAEDVEVFRADEVVDCLRGVVGAEDGGIVGEDVDDAGDGEGGEPEGTDGCEEQGDPFCPELLDKKLYQPVEVGWRGYKHDDDCD